MSIERSGGGGGGEVSISQTGTANNIDIEGITPVGGRLPTDGSGVTQPVSAVSLPLPTGAAADSSLSSILTELQAKADLAETQPISAASLPLPAGAATAALQTTGNTSLSSLDTKAAVSFATRSDSYTGVANGTAINAASAPLSQFGVQVVGIGGTPTLWSVVLEGSLDGVTYTTILPHTTTLGIGVVLWTGGALYPSLYVRSRCVALTLGPATSITATIVGVR